MGVTASGQAGFMRRLWQRVRRRLAERRALALVELAMIGPVFLIGVLVLFQFAYLFLSQQLLEIATESAARSIMTGNAQGNSMSSGGSPTATSSVFVTNVLCPAALYLKCSNLLVNVEQVPSGDDYFALAAPAIASGTSVITTNLSFCNGQSGNFMLLNVYYLAPIWIFGSMPFIGPIWPGALKYGGSTVIPLYAAAAFADEQFTLPNSLTSNTSGSGACT